MKGTSEFYPFYYSLDLLLHSPLCSMMIRSPEGPSRSGGTEGSCSEPSGPHYTAVGLAVDRALQGMVTKGAHDISQCMVT